MSTSRTAAGFLHELTAQQWIDEVLPLAMAVVDAAEPSDDRDVVRVRARQTDSFGDAPHGGLMLTWPERTGRDAVINHLFDCRAYLALYRAFLDELSDAAQFYAVLRDGSRLKVAVTNDVLQVLARGPAGRYSMIRHHALMFLAAHTWLPRGEQAIWSDLYHASVPLAAAQYSASDAFGAARVYLDNLERSAFAALDRLAAVVLPGSPVTLDSDVRIVLRYIHAANAAVAVLIDAVAGLSEPKRFEWLVQQLAVDYRDDAYLVDEWATMAAG